jgi:hypothetical protein
VLTLLTLLTLLLLLLLLPPLPVVVGRCVRVRRAVLFAVLDHYMRRNEGQKRVIGTLLGVVDEVHFWGRI